MRRSHTVKHNARPSLALVADDLGVLREGDESNEDVLRRQLLEKDRECEKLYNANLAMKEELKARPPVEEFQSFQREKKNLEIILQGTQRENERSLNEINRLKERVQLLERELSRLAGDNWQSNLEIPSSSTSNRPSIHHQRSNTIALGSPHSSFHPHNLVRPASPPETPRHSQRRGSGAASPSPQGTTAQQQQKEQERVAAIARLEDIRLLILGMDQRLALREGSISQLVENAEKEGEKCERLAAKLVEI